MWRVLAALALCGAASCSSPVKFNVHVDEPVEGGTLTLNGSTVRLMKNGDGVYWAKWHGADASGRIDIDFLDGSRTTCPIGYVTNGMGIQQFTVSRHVCNWFGPSL